jgi:hypothetical protein
VKPWFALAIFSASLAAAPALAQDGGADPGAPTAYAGVSKEAFYSVEQRMSAIEQRLRSMGRAAGRALAQMRSIRAFETQQRARHGGELRDWDREALNVRLDRLVQQHRLT